MQTDSGALFFCCRTNREEKTATVLAEGAWGAYSVFPKEEHLSDIQQIIVLVDFDQHTDYLADCRRCCG